MRLFQQPARTAEQVAAGEPLAIAPEEVMAFDEAEWLARAYRHDAPQLTMRAALIGSALGFFLSFTNVYIGLKTGWFLGVNLTACLVVYGVSAGLHRAGAFRTPLSILETSAAVATTSSAAYATGTMVVAAFPAMLLLSVTPERPGGSPIAWPVVALWTFLLGALGVTLAIPLKRAMINRERLKFPSGIAAAVAIRGLYSRRGEALRSARALYIAAAAAALGPILKDLEVIRKVDPGTGLAVRTSLLPGASNVFDGLARLWPAATRRMTEAGPAAIHPAGRPFALSDYLIKLDHGPALVFAGMLIGWRVAAWMLVGALVLATAIAPAALDASWQDGAGAVVRAAAAPGSAWRDVGIWVGAPLLVSSSLVTFVSHWRTTLRAFAGIIGPRKAVSAIDPLAAIEVPASWFVTSLLVSGLGIVVVAWQLFDIPLPFGVLSVALTFVLALVACRSTGESDITPGGALGQLTQLAFGVMLPQNVIANLQTASITAGASHASADLLSDLKTGHLLGANPRRQLVAQALGLVSGTLASTLGYFVLVPDALALTGRGGRAPVFPAVAAQQWRAVAEVFKRGIGSLHPMCQRAMAWGVVIGCALALTERFVKKPHARWVPSATGLGLGFMLPFFYPLAMFLGAALAELARAVSRGWAERYLVPIAAGGIAGESIVGVLVQALNTFALS